MMKPVYIRSASAISPQHSFNGASFCDPVMTSDTGILFVVDADYSKYINPVAIRRMSRLIKMGISAGMQCLQEAGIEQPDAIITGTARGSMSDTEQFITEMLNLNEQAPNPTAFIQSTYNSVNGWIALQTKCIGYNQTYVNRGFSFELSLFDAQLLLQEETKPAYMLVGGFDELTPDYWRTKYKIDYWKKQPPHSLSLLEHSDTPGTIGGEGAAFVMVTNDSTDAICSLLGVEMHLAPSAEEFCNSVEALLENNSLAWNDIDVLLTGMNGDSRHQPLHEAVVNLTDSSTHIAVFKHLTGEYDTSSGFAMWLVTEIFKSQSIPQLLQRRKGSREKIRYVLIINNYILNSFPVILLKIAG